jgi:hypothetical protein
VQSGWDRQRNNRNSHHTQAINAAATYQNKLEEFERRTETIGVGSRRCSAPRCRIRSPSWETSDSSEFT